MEKYALKHANIRLGFLTHREESDIFVIEFENLSIENEKLLESLKDCYSSKAINSDDARCWIMERIAPAHLIGIDEFLRIAEIEENNTWELVKATKGYSTRDNLWLERVR
ncbi:MAG TPA: hypothetical protein VIM51_07460 [Desulfosporosinus sp.]